MLGVQQTAPQGPRFLGHIARHLHPRPQRDADLRAPVSCEARSSESRRSKSRAKCFLQLVPGGTPPLRVARGARCRQSDGPMRSIRRVETEPACPSLSSGQPHRVGADPADLRPCVRPLDAAGPHLTERAPSWVARKQARSKVGSKCVMGCSPMQKAGLSVQPFLAFDWRAGVDSWPKAHRARVPTEPEGPPSPKGEGHHQREGILSLALEGLIEVQQKRGELTLAWRRSSLVSGSTAASLGPPNGRCVPDRPLW